MRLPDHCSDCILSSIWPSTKHYLEATNRLHWSSISVMYFQRFRRWPIFNQLRGNVACFLANNAWYPYVAEHLRHLNRGPTLNTLLCVTDQKRVCRLLGYDTDPVLLFTLLKQYQKYYFIILICL